MIRLYTFFKLWRGDDRGVTAIEYAILAGVVAVALATLGTDIFDELTTAIDNAFGESPAG